MAAKSGSPKYWREIKYRYRLVGSKCQSCGKISFPHRSVCPGCGHRTLQDYKLSEKGKILSYTVIRKNYPEGYEKLVPYTIGIVELPEGVKVLSQIVDVEPKNISIGMSVALTFRRVREDGAGGIIEYGYKFKPYHRR